MTLHRPQDRPALDARIEALRPGLDLLGLAACVVDAQMRYRYANPAYLAQAGHADDAGLIGRTPDEAFARRPQDSRREQLLRALEGETVVFNRPAIEGPHAGRWMRAHYFPLRDDAAAVVGALVVLVDVDEDHQVRAALDQQRKQLQLVIDNIGVPMSYIDRDRRFRFANQPGVDWKVADTTLAIGKRVEELFDEPAMAVIAPEIERGFRGEKRTYERLATLQDGQRRWVRVHIVPDFAPDGAVQGLYTLMIDVDQDRRMREALQRQEAQLRYFAENIPGPIAVVDGEFRYVFANKVYLEMHGRRLEEIAGRPLNELAGEEPEVEPLAERLRRGERCTYERLIGPPGGAARWHMMTLAPVMDAAGRFNGCYIVGSDIHDMKEAQDRLRGQEAQMRLFADNIPDAVAYLNRERVIVFANRHFAAQRGTTPESIIGLTTAQLMGEEVAAWIAKRTQKVLDRGEVATYERQVTLPDGGRRWVHVKAVPDFGDAGEVRGMYVVAHDITDVKHAQEQLEDKERQLRQVIDSVPTPMCYVDASAHYRYVNDAFLEYIGKPADAIVGRPVRDVLGEERWQLMSPILERVRAGESLSVERLVRFADGRSRWMTVRLSPRIVDGQYLGYYATTSDIHEQKLVEDELRRANTILSAHFDNTPLAVIEMDTELRIVRWSGQAEALFGWSASETLGRPLTGWRHVYEEDEAAASAMIRSLVEGRERHATLMHRNYRKDGSVIWVEWHNSALRDDAGRVISILSLAQDVSSRIQAEERLQFMATHDGLTGLPNSVLLNDRLEAALVRARRAQAGVGVMFLDLDRFKDVNDTLGHRVGDGLLRELSRRIRAALRQSDLLARISGDEFVVVLEDLPDDAIPDQVARKILDEVRRPFHIEGNEIHVSGSLGLALYPDDGADAETLLKNADAAMYHAKELGRNGFRMFSQELGERRAQRMQVESALRRALREGELTLQFQPILDIASGKVTRAEALLRWHDPERGLVLPQGFVPLAEETGLGHAVGHWVIEHACRQARAWRDMGLGDITMCVNLSASQMRDTGMVADLRRILELSGCEPGWLQFEITETSMVRDVAGVSDVIARLRALGVRIAIDDFGTGFSSLSHLRHLPVDVLKVDKSFVADIGEEARRPGFENAGGEAIVSAVIGLARGLGLQVVAEGVEKESQLAFLAREGCHGAQGYLVCPPLAAAQFHTWLVRHNGLPEPLPRAGARKRKRVPG